jgi:hypothetical protein
MAAPLQEQPVPDPKNSLMVLVAGPYRSGTDDDPALIAQNMHAMEEAALSVFRAGHLPVAGEWFALPLIRIAGSTHMGDAAWDAIFHPIAERIAARCDVCLRIGGASAGADAMVAIFTGRGRPVFHRVEDLPPASVEAA